jgi:hypothetical protein
VPALHLVKQPLQGDQHWQLDLGLAEGLITSTAKKSGDTVLYLDVAPLRERLHAMKTTVSDQFAQAGSKPEARELKEKLVLVKRLEQLWLPGAKMQPRRGERQPAARIPVLVATNWSEMAIFMREARPWKPHDPYHYTYDDAAELVARGRAPTPKSEKQQDAFANLHPDRQGWQIHDTSETGCRIVSSTKQAAQLQLGTLVGLLRETDTRWRLAIIRRLKRRTAEHTELGLEIIAENSMLVMPEPVTQRDTGYSVNGIDVSAKGKRFDALYLPPQDRSANPVYSIVVPVGEYAAGKLLTMTLDGQPRVIRLAVAIELNKDWVWTTFEVVSAQQRY